MALGDVPATYKAVCPNCGRGWAEKDGYHRRVISQAMFEQLQRLESHGDWLHNRVLSRGFSGGSKLDHNYFRYWGFTESDHKGSLRITPLGQKFLTGEVGAPAWLLVGNGHVAAESSDIVFVKDFN